MFGKLPQPLEQENVDEQDPEAAAAGARGVVPGNPLRMGGEDVSKGEPGPAEAPVLQMEVFEAQPEQDQGGIAEVIAHAGADQAEAQPGYAHEETVGEDGAHGAGAGRVPDPPGGADIPDEHGEVGPAEEPGAADALAFQP